MKLIQGLVCPPGVEHVEMFVSDLPSGKSLYNVCGRMTTQETFSGPMGESFVKAKKMWNNMFASTES